MTQIQQVAIKYYTGGTGTTAIEARYNKSQRPDVTIFGIIPVPSARLLLVLVDRKGSIPILGRWCVI